MSRLRDTSLEIAVISLTYSAAALRKQHARSSIESLRVAADAQDAARKEISEFLDSRATTRRDNDKLNEALERSLPMRLRDK